MKEKQPAAPSVQHGVRLVPAYFLPGTGQPPVREDCPVIEEAMLTIDVESVGWYTLMWTPTASLHEVLGFSRDQGVLGATDDPEVLSLTAGFLFTEGLIRSLKDLRRMEICSNDPGIIRVSIPPASVRDGGMSRWAAPVAYAAAGKRSTIWSQGSWRWQIRPGFAARNSTG